MYDQAIDLGNRQIQGAIRRFEAGASRLFDTLADLIDPVQEQEKISSLARYNYADQSIRDLGDRIFEYLDPIIQPQNSNLNVGHYFPETGGYGLKVSPGDSEFVDQIKSPVVNLNIQRIPDGVRVKLGGNQTIDFCFGLAVEEDIIPFTVRVLNPGKPYHR